MDRIPTEGLLSTGRAAQLSGVTRNAVLKWIKAGKIGARRTPGGHYRIPRESLTGSLAEAEPKRGSQRESRSEAPLFCWEFHSQGQSCRAECRQCVVYRAHALRCFEMSYLTKEKGFQGVYCRDSCNECEYYRRSRPTPTRVLVVTNNPALERSLSGDNDGRFDFRFVGSEYKCSEAIGSFNPECIVVDRDFPQQQRDELSRHLLHDPRVQAITILSASLTCRRELGTECTRFPSIGEPLSVASLHRKLAGLQLVRAPITT